MTLFLVIQNNCYLFMLYRWTKTLW